jgi:uncharacterized membrane protein
LPKRPNLVTLAITNTHKTANPIKQVLDFFEKLLFGLNFIALAEIVDTFSYFAQKTRTILTLNLKAGKKVL